MTGLVLQTQDDCPPGLLGEWAAANGFALEVVRVGREAPRISAVKLARPSSSEKRKLRPARMSSIIRSGLFAALP